MQSGAIMVDSDDRGRLIAEVLHMCYIATCHVLQALSAEANPVSVDLELAGLLGIPRFSFWNRCF